jgi:hypothetical protein
VLAQIYDAVVAVDNDERITYLNAAAERPLVGSIGRWAPSVQHPLGFISPATVMPELGFIGPSCVVLELIPSCWQFRFIGFAFSHG